MQNDPKKKPAYTGWRMPDLGTVKRSEKNAGERDTAELFAHRDETFKLACKLAGLPVTARQASKWKRKMGLAYTFREAAQKQLLGA